MWGRVEPSENADGKLMFEPPSGGVCDVRDGRAETGRRNGKPSCPYFRGHTSDLLRHMRFRAQASGLLAERISITRNTALFAVCSSPLHASSV